MKLHELSPVEGSTKERKRIGRGAGSGQGKTAGKGHKGQKARAGRGMRPGFEGGQMPLQRRLPKRGFNNIFRSVVATVNVSDLEAKFENGAVVDAAALVESGALKDAKDGIKILTAAIPDTDMNSLRNLGDDFKSKLGDSVVVRMGNVIPFDGVIRQGEAMVNQASMTGESLPVRKEVGTYVYAGTVVEEGEIVLQVREMSGSTRFEKIVTMIEDSEKLKSTVESRAEHLADRLVPYTLLGTGLVYALTRNVTKALAVLMVWVSSCSRPFSAAAETTAFAIE